MHFIFPTATISSISGAAIVVILSGEVTASIDFASELPLRTLRTLRKSQKNRGVECSFVNAFRIQETRDHTGIDTGILGCGAGETCIEDQSSSIGGHCVSLENEDLFVESHRGLSVACIFSNGTAGQKCVGTSSCDGVEDLSEIGCGSCIGRSACYYSGGPVGENSCRGTYACYDMSGYVGHNSCNGQEACDYGDANVGDNSCNDFLACDGVNSNVGDCLCNGPRYCEGCSSPDMDFDNCGENPSNGRCQRLTQSPSKLPSKSPSNLPTSSPSKMPTKSPEESPSTGPSKSPSKLSTSASMVKIELNTGKNINMFDVKVFSSGADVAAGKPSTQSSTLRKFYPGLAVDGTPESFSHTDISNQTFKGAVWWQVDLGVEYVIDSVKITNRWCQDSSDPTGCLCRLSNAHLSLIDDDGIVTVSNSLGNTCGKSNLWSDFGSLPTCLYNASAVKIESSTNKPINLFEVQVFSAGKDNVAIGGTATQSSTRGGLSKFDASRAVDGSVNTFSHTESNNAWWHVDLNSMHGIDHVEISNRWCRNPSDPTGCLCRLSNASITLLDNLGSVVATELVGDTCGAGSLKISFRCGMAD